LIEQLLPSPIWMLPTMFAPANTGICCA